MKGVKFLSAVAAACVFSFASARDIRGTVYYENDSTSAVGVECRLMAGSERLAAAVTGTDGKFSISTGQPAPVSLEVTAAGCNPIEIIIESDARRIDLGAIYLPAVESLTEVTATAQSTVESRGRTIVYPSADILKASTTSLSLFQKLPLAGLETDPVNRSITVDGGTPMILINGVPSTISDVNSLNPDDIKKVEFSRVTPARWADRGTRGLIAITLKRHTDGGTVYMWGRSAVSTAFVDGNIRASYHQGASQFTLSYVPSWRNYQKVYDTTVGAYVGDDFRIDYSGSDRNPFNYYYHNMRLKYDFTPTESTVFSATFRADPGGDGRRVNGTERDSYIGSYEKRNTASSHDFTPSLDLYVRHDFGGSNSLEAQVVGTLSSGDYRRSNVYLYPTGSANVYTMDVDNSRRSLISEVCYSHRFGDGTDLSAGYQNTLSRSTNTYLHTDYRPVLTENNNYVYAAASRQFGPVYLSLSTGAKLFWVKNDINRRNFVRNLTTAQGSWRIDSHWNIQAAFSYSPAIPSLSALTDYPMQISPYLVSNGNPALKVTDWLVYQIMPAYNVGKLRASLLVTYYDARNYSFNNVMYRGGGMFLSQTVNADSYNELNANLNIRVNDLGGFGFSVNLGVDRYRVAGADFSHTLTAFNASANLWYAVGKWNFSYWRKIPGKYMSGYTVFRNENGDALGIEYSPDDHWTLGASWMYMFDRKGTRYPSWGYAPANPAHQTRYIRDNGNMVVLSVTYKADFGTIFNTRRRSLNNSDRGSSLLKM